MSYPCTKACASDGCSAEFKSHRWGVAKAHGEGWFLQRNGDAWCPQHTPAWVAQWRTHRKEAAA